MRRILDGDCTWLQQAARTLVAVLLVGGCGGVEPGTAGRDELLAVHVEGAAFRDASGRQVLLRGYNARVDGIFDVTFDDGRVALEDIPPFDESDAQLFEELGLNILRLPVNWSGLEPHPRQYNAAYMRRIDAVVELARRHHFYVLIDLHQDAYSKEFGEDGQPLWAIVPPPPALLQGPLTDLDQRRLSMPVLEAGINFFANVAVPDGRAIQDAFTAAVQQLVRRYVGNPSVIGYEAFNEPIILFNDPILDAFHQRFATAVHAIDPDAAIFFEPTALRNQSDRARVPTAPWPNGRGVYAPHIYTTVFSPPNNSWASEDPAMLEPSMAAAAQEAAAWGTPLFVGEFGIDQTLERGPRYLAAELDLQDHFLASSTVWVWRETGYWGLKDADGVERTATVRAISRPYPRAVAGDLLAIERPTPTVLHVRYRGSDRTGALPNEVAVSTAQFADYEIRCDGAPVAFVRRTGRAEFHCPGGVGEHAFDLVGKPEPAP